MEYGVPNVHPPSRSSSSPNILQKVSSFSGPEPLINEATVCAKVCRGRSSTSWSHWSSSRFSCSDNLDRVRWVER